MTYITFLNSKEKTPSIIHDIKKGYGDDVTIKKNEVTTHVSIAHTSSMIINAGGHIRLIICSTTYSRIDYKIDIELNDVNSILEL